VYSMGVEPSNELWDIISNNSSWDMGHVFNGVKPGKKLCITRVRSGNSSHVVLGYESRIQLEVS